MFIVTTSRLKELCDKGCEIVSRRPSDDFWKDVDPKGRHVLNPVLENEPLIVRCLVMCKMKDKDESVDVFIDVLRVCFEQLLADPIVNESKNDTL